MKYFAKIKYLGTDFHGFQVQPDKRTIQGELCRGLADALGVACKVTGCSRTDAGVHANEFCLTVDADGATVPPFGKMITPVFNGVATATCNAIAPVTVGACSTPLRIAFFAPSKLSSDG